MSVVCQQLNIMGLCIILGEGEARVGSGGAFDLIHRICLDFSENYVLNILKIVFLMNMKEGNILQK